MKSIFFYITLIIVTVSCSDKEAEQHSGHDSEHDTMLSLTQAERQAANIRIDTAVVKPLYEETTLIGTAAPDELQVNVISSRVRGRIDRLFIRNPGEFVKSGAALYSIYSEELLAFENDYLLAIDEHKKASTQKDITQRMVQSARRRLELLTLTDQQIKALEKTRDVSPLITFYSNRSGYLSQLTVREGEYTEVGTPLFRLADYSTLWIEAQLYSTEITYLSQSPAIEVEFEAFPGERLQAEIVYTNPSLEENTKINLLRLRVSNVSSRYKPGMMAYVYFKRNKKKTLVIPKSALLLENFTSVWLETPEGMFEQRMVKTGISNKREVEILEGLSPGDRVVASGAYLLNSAWKVKQGGGAMEGMDM